MGYSITLMRTLQPPGIPWTKLVTPQSNRFSCHEDTSFRKHIFDIPVTQIETIVQPDSVTNDLRRKSVAFIQSVRNIHPSTVAELQLTGQYRIIHITLSIHWRFSSEGNMLYTAYPFISKCYQVCSAAIQRSTSVLSLKRCVEIRSLPNPA